MTQSEGSRGRGQDSGFWVQGSGEGRGTRGEGRGTPAVWGRATPAQETCGVDPFEPASTRTGSGRCTALGLPAVLVLMLNALAPAEPGFVETFADDPIAAGRMVLHDPPGTSGPRFVYQPEMHRLLAHYNAIGETARLVGPLCRPLTQDDTFTFRVTFVIRSQGFNSPDDQSSQIAFGLMNSATTGPDRTSISYSDAWEVVSFDYFPQEPAGYEPGLGPPGWLDYTSAVPTIVSSSGATDYYNSMSFGQGSETLLVKREQEEHLPKDQPLTVVYQYKAAARKVTVRILDAAGPRYINGPVDENDPGGGLDGDPTTIQSPFDHGTGSFAVDSFGLFLWNDYWATNSQPYPFFQADVDFLYMELSWLPDFDGDSDVDANDLAHFQDCQLGPGIPQEEPACRSADLDCDGDVDQDDFGIFQRNLTGPQ